MFYMIHIEELDKINETIFILQTTDKLSPISLISPLTYIHWQSLGLDLGRSGEK